MVPPPSTSYMSVAMGLLQSTLLRNKKRSLSVGGSSCEVVPSPRPRIQDTSPVADHTGASAGGDGDTVSLPGPVGRQKPTK
eukprot:4225558-Amphidinium_carterae.1